MATTKLTAADQKKILIAEVFKLSKVKLGLNFVEADAKDFAKRSVLELRSNIRKMQKLEDYGPEVAPVRDMSMESTPERVSRGDGSTMGYGKARPVGGISDAQKGLIIRLTKEKHGTDLEAAENAALLECIVKLSKAKASEHIDRLIKLPRKVSTVAPAPAVITPAAVIPAGIYAIEDGETKCYEIDYGRKGTQWEGFLFLSRVSSDDRWPVKNREEKARILLAIQADVEAAGRLAAHTLRRCRNPRCKRLLTDTKNPYFAEGYGPECGAKREW